ncbi:MAG: hypothetical protein ACRCSF_13520 [Mycobacteriaceae bacterium]
MAGVSHPSSELVSDDDSAVKIRIRRRAVRPSGPVLGASLKLDEIIDSTVSYVAPTAGITRNEERDGAGLMGGQSSQNLLSSGRSSGRFRKIIGLAIPVFLICGLLVSAVWLYLIKQDNQALEAKRQNYIDLARQTAMNITSISADTVQQDMDRLIALSSGELKDDLTGRQQNFVTLVQTAQISFDGEILEAALESIEGNDGKVLVVAQSRIKDPTSTEQPNRAARVRITIHDDNGVLTASKVEWGV